MPTTSASASSRRVWVLLAHDPATGCATAPVGVAGTDGETTAVSWLPLTYQTRATWAWRLAGLGAPAQLTAAAADTNGITLGALEIDPAPALDLRGAIEAAVDDLLVGATTEGMTGG